MLTAPTQPEVLWDNEERTYWRTWRDEPGNAPHTVLIVTPAAKNPTTLCLERLAHEYGLKDDLDAQWAVRPLELVHDHGRTTLVLEDPGAEPLKRLLGAPMELPTFLRLAEAMAGAVRGMHPRGLVHNDINPANILVDEGAERVWLTGFGIASRVPRERQAPTPPESLAGTLAYMAPEQTGRMNRSIDSRSDLYSLGVTFYQMLTGALPFSTSDPMEWVHCHIARTPRSPGERFDAIPAPVSQLVLKLLAKNAEDRYQTAAGVAHDLRRCRAEWEARGCIDEFALGEHDASDRLLIPEKLYGRSHEVAALVSAFDQVIATGQPQLVLVSGYAGVGKSSVVHELHRALVPPRGLFASGKFDQYMQGIPYATLAQAFQGLVRQLLSSSEAELQDWREALDGALGSNGRLIVDLIPELELVIGAPPPLAEVAPLEAQRRFQAVLRRFIGVFATATHPLVLFLDDLQWLDAATLDLIEDLLTQDDIRHLLLIGAYRDNEVGAAHPLTRKLEAIRQTGATARDIDLAPLSYDDLAQLVADSLCCEPGQARRLAQVVHEKTAGNPFFARQLLKALAEEGLLAFDYAEARWRWDVDRIDAHGYADNVVDLIAAKLTRLPPEAQAALRLLACVGAEVEFALLGAVCETPLEALHESLWEAVRAGMVLRSAASYSFRHDRIQEAAYSLIPEEARAETHLGIGRRLLAHSPPNKREQVVFEIVAQLDRGLDLITASDEREQLAELHLLAGRRAMASAAHASALKYLASGAGILSDRAWERRRDLIFELELLRAECEMLTGDPDAAETRLIMLSGRASSTAEQAVVVGRRMAGYNLRDQNDRIVALGLEHLRFLGAESSPLPTQEQARREYEVVLSRIGSRPIEELVNLPLMTDPTALATLDVLINLWPAMVFSDPNLIALTVCRAVNLSLEHGNSDASCIAYVRLGDIARTCFDADPVALRFGRLGYELAERRGLKRFQAMACMIFGCRILPWTQHIATARDVLRRGVLAGNESGDFAYAAYNAGHLHGAMLAAADPLIEVQREVERGLAFARALQADWFPVDSMGVQLQMTRMLRGLTHNFGSFDDEHYSERQVERRLVSNPHLGYAECEYRIRKMQACVLAGDHAAALQVPPLSEQLLSGARPMLAIADYHFYGALARAACCNSDSPHRHQHLKALAAHHDEIEIAARHCPENFANRAALVEGEMARLEGRDLDATRLYEQAIRSARENAFVQHQGLAYEVAARFYSARGFEIISNAYLREARDCYLRWGADGKVQQLDRLYPHLAPLASRHSAFAAGPENQQFDAASVVRASQALSGEIELPNLIDKLMTIALQSAGADRGLLVVPEQTGFRIEAEAAADGDAVVLRYDASGGPSAPETVVRYVMRTHESLILDDAARPHLFSDDPYFARRPARSVLCLPLVRQGALSGVLYLENTLASHVFTADRTRLLELVASQAAISLENARLYADLELQVGLLQQLPVSAWTLEPDGTPDFVNAVWLDFSGQTRDFVRSHPEAWMTAIHPEDRETAVRKFWEGVHSGQGFAFESRSRRARDGAYRRHLQQAVVLRDAEGNVLKFVGTTTDIDDQKRAEETLRQAQADLAHVGRVATLNAMTASIAHEVSQPLSGILTNAGTGLRMLAAEPPNVAGAVETARRTIRDANRASDVIKRLREMFSNKTPVAEPLDLNGAARDVIALSAGELQRRGAELQMELTDGLPLVSADRVQLQQVILNLLLNGADAMEGVDDRPRSLLVMTEIERDSVRLSVRDVGCGIDPETIEKLFEPFHTTKATGMGIGLSICRSIIASHLGRLWAMPNDGPGTTFGFSIPVARELMVTPGQDAVADPA